MCNQNRSCFAECDGPEKLLAAVAPLMVDLRPFCPKAKAMLKPAESAAELPEFAIAAWQYVDPAGKFRVTTWAQLQQYQSKFLKLIEEGHGFRVLQDFTDINQIANIQEGYLRCDSQYLVEMNGSGQAVQFTQPIKRCGSLKLIQMNSVKPSQASTLTMTARQNMKDYLTVFIRLTA